MNECVWEWWGGAGSAGSGTKAAEGGVSWGPGWSAGYQELQIEQCRDHDLFRKCSLAKSWQPFRRTSRNEAEAAPQEPSHEGLEL